MRKVDAEAVQVAFRKAEIISKGVGLVPGGAACNVVAEQIEKAKVLYTQIVDVIRN